MVFATPGLWIWFPWDQYENVCTHCCKSLWIRAPAKCLKCKCTFVCPDFKKNSMCTCSGCLSGTLLLNHLWTVLGTTTETSKISTNGLEEIRTRLEWYPDFYIVISSYSHTGIYGIAQKGALKMQEKLVGPLTKMLTKLSQTNSEITLTRLPKC